MLVSEFINRTSYQPTAEEYAEIEKQYYHFNGDKDKFCRAWVKLNPHKAGTLWAKIKENNRINKVLDKLVRHIVTYAKKKTFDPNMLYHMNYEDRSNHRHFVCSKVGAKDILDLHNVFHMLDNADAVRSCWSTKTWEYYRILDRII